MTVSEATSSRRRRSVLDPHSVTFHAFADTLYTGVLIFALALPVVTWFAALSAGVQALREAREQDSHVTVGSVWRPFVSRIRRHWFVHLVLPAAIVAVLVLDVLILPFLGADATTAMVIPIVLASAVGAIALRVAGTWRDGVPVRTTLAVAWRRMSEDGAGSALLALAVAAAGAIVSFVPLLAIVMAGPLALAGVAVDHRLTEEP